MWGKAPHITTKRSAKGELKNSPVDCFLRGNALQGRAFPYKSVLFNFGYKNSPFLGAGGFGEGVYVTWSAVSGATVSHLNMSSIRSLEVQAPDIEIQKRIGAILARIDDKIELNTAINENLEQQIGEYFKEMFPDVLNENGKETLGKLISFSNGKKRPDEEGQIPVYGGMLLQLPARHDLGENYPETSGTLLFAYSALRSARLGITGSAIKHAGEKAFSRVTEDFLAFDDPLPVMRNICLTAGLGGSPYRDGSAEYYLSERIAENDAKGIAPYIMTYTEIMR